MAREQRRFLTGGAALAGFYLAVADAARKDKGADPATIAWLLSELMAFERARGD